MDQPGLESLAAEAARRGIRLSALALERHLADETALGGVVGSADGGPDTDAVPLAASPLFVLPAATAAREKMRQVLEVMRQSAARGIAQAPISRGGLVGGDARRVALAVEAGRGLTGPIVGRAMARALAVAEVNAAMGRIVAAPTAGSCGVLPGVLLTVAEALGSSEEQLIMALFTAGAVGDVIRGRASISGAAGGCQAEIGSAAAMAAAAAVELAGGSPEACVHAAALALKSMLGLVCDPVGGLVEVPCVKRNAIAASIALAAAEMVLAGVRSAVPPDQVIEVMGRVGRELPESLRETGIGGLAGCEWARGWVESRGGAT